MKLRIAISVPNGVNKNTLPAVKSINSCIDRLKQIHDCELYIAQGADVADSRNHAITKNRKLKQNEFCFDAILIIDCDIEFTFENILQLIENYNHEGMVSGLIENRIDKSKFNAGYLKYGIEKEIEYLKYSDISEEKMKVDWCSGGFHLIGKSVFTKMEFPYYERMKMIDGDTVIYHNDIVGFSIKLYKAGIDNLIITDCRPKHINLNDRGYIMEQQKNAMQEPNIDEIVSNAVEAIYSLRSVYKMLRQHAISLQNENIELKKKLEPKTSVE